MAAKKSSRSKAKRSTHLNKYAAHVAKLVRRARPNRTWAIAGAIVAVILVGAVMASRPSKLSDFPKPEARPASESAASMASIPASVPEPTVEPAAAPTPEAAPITVTGCLARDEDTFRLNDTAGENAPTKRSWKTGFLKRKPASIHVVDASNRLRLTNYVGRRIAVTGTMVDREMQARSLQRVAASCG